MWTVARYALKEAMRKRLVVASAILTALFLVLYWVMLTQMGTSGLTGSSHVVALSGLYLGLFVAYVMIAMFALMTLASSVGGDMDDGYLLALLPRPVGRAPVLLGKWLGYLLVMLAYASLLYFGIVFLVVWHFHVGPLAFSDVMGGWLAFCMEGAVVSVLTLFGATLMSTVATGITISSLVLIAFMGGALSEMSTFWSTGRLFTQIGTLTELLIPTDALYRRGIYLAGRHLSSGLAFGSNLGPFGVSRPPGGLFLLYALIYMVAVIVLAVWSFRRHDF